MNSEEYEHVTCQESHEQDRVGEHGPVKPRRREYQEGMDM